MPGQPNLEQQFSSLSTNDNDTSDNKQITSTTVDTTAASDLPAVVTPTKESCDVTLDDTSTEETSSQEDNAGSNGSVASADRTQMLVRKTEHKLLEEQGALDDEPLLKSNPHRFVIFPIQDNDVRVIEIT